ncbi:hypothetical protein VW23_013940 [Devosia insulae DS-56]|uniref:Lysozyme inhibitor n=1 Tax=Devosia insulae DS-56 TaxID=1116389 RepID=A0A1E5XTN9_9HYPH|nr:hypothetical protein [Devosia insulae]OEO31941.1 hypothetical protein VW23_013940 [Devosia insulae DS-56]
MRRWLLATAVLAVVMSPGYAADRETFGHYTLICENPGGRYVAVLLDHAAEVVIDPDSTHTSLPIIGRIQTKEIGALVLRTPDPTVTEILHLWPEAKMEVFSDGDMVQVDECST